MGAVTDRRSLHQLKVFSPSHRLNLENCEDDLVQKTEVAITLMKTVLDNVGPWFLSTPRISISLRLHNASSLNL